MAATMSLLEQADGLRFRVDGIDGVCRFESYRAIYPYEHTVTKLWWEPTAAGKRSDAYQEMRRRLGDDWVTDVSESTELLADVARALAGQCFYCGEEITHEESEAVETPGRRAHFDCIEEAGALADEFVKYELPALQKQAGGLW